MNHPIIIGIHGLANKPPERLLRQWWRAAIREGWGWQLFGELPDENFDLVYWAGVRYASPIPVPELKHPYRRRTGKPSLRRNGAFDLARRVTRGTFGWAGDLWKKLTGQNSLADVVLNEYLEDIGMYYSHKNTRDRIDWLLLDRIKGYAKEQRPITIVAHSMGTVIAYNVLRANEDHLPKIDLFTVGSPLGLPTVRSKIEMEFGDVRTPRCVFGWWNFADAHDPVAIDSHLRDDFAPNDLGVQPNDDLVINPGSLHHEAVDYLRCPELALKLWRSYQ